MKKNSVYYLLFNPFAIGVFLFAVLVFISFYPYILYDEVLWSYIGRIWNENNLVPYVNSVENKPPGIFILYKLNQLFFDGNIFFIRLFGAICSVLSSFLLYKIGKLLNGHLCGMLCMSIFGLMMSWFLMNGWSLAHTETFMVFFSILAFYLFVKHKMAKHFKYILFGIGTLLGCSLFFKQIAITTIVAFFLFVLIDKKSSLKSKLRDILRIGFGVIFINLSGFLVLYMSGVSLLQYLEGSWLILLNSGSSGTGFSDYMEGFFKTFFCSRFLMLYPLLILVYLKRELFKKELYVLVLLWFLLDFSGAILSGNFYGHQLKQMLPSLSILFGIVLSNYKLFGKTNFLKQLSDVKILILVIVYFFPYLQMAKVGKSLWYTKNLDHKVAAKWIKNNSSKQDYIYLFGADYKLISTLLYSERVSSSKYFSSMFVSREEQRQQIFSEIMAKPPKYILDYKEDINIRAIYGNSMYQYFLENYRLRNNFGNILLYERN
ncbi:glycosyltransferase family 39 protein [Algibacter sp. 2305UL17-15]|uniref:ArnT family glycosyltransferase n=1 Tax=Algibacter sp. 2305UL17-15 TaxID=3231268 RepID=UPI003459B19B